MTRNGVLKGKDLERAQAVARIWRRAHAELSLAQDQLGTEVRRLLEVGYTQAEIARGFGMANRQQVQEVLRREQRKGRWP